MSLRSGRINFENIGNPFMGMPSCAINFDASQYILTYG